MTIPFWYDDPVAWDGIRVGSRGTFAPGIVERLDVGRPRKVDAKTGPGVDGATLTFQGYELAPVTIEMKMWTAKHWELFQLFCQSFEPMGGRNSSPLPRDFVHPILAARGIKSLFVKDIRGPSMPDAQGMVRYTIEAIQYAPPPKKSATSTPNKSLAASGAPATVYPTAIPGGQTPPVPPTIPTPTPPTAPKP